MLNPPLLKLKKRLEASLLHANDRLGVIKKGFGRGPIDISLFW
jgi:hypothetical protein